MAWKNSTEAISAMDRQVVGWPDPEAVVMRREWARNRLAMPARASAEMFEVMEQASWGIVREGSL